MGKLVIPKASEKKNETEQTIQIYYEANDWLSNADFIKLYKEKFGLIGTADDDSAYTKRGQIGAYFGFIEWEDIHNDESRRRITPRGRSFWMHLSSRNISAAHEDIMCSLEEVPFGRHNFGCHTSDSDLEPMSVFFLAAIELGYVSNGEFAYLIYLIDDQNKSIEEAISSIKFMRSLAKKTGVPADYGRFTQPTPIAVLAEWGVLEKIRLGRIKPYRIAVPFLQKYEARIRTLKLWNTAKDCPLPVKSALLSIESEYKDSHVVSSGGIITDAVYQDLVDSAIPSTTTDIPVIYVPAYPDGKTVKSNRPPTNPALGKEAIRDAGFKCTICEHHTTFTKPNGSIFMEVHHLVPLERQGFFLNRLDIKANLVPLCPLCHKLIHYGSIEEKSPLITQLYNERKERLAICGIQISLEELLACYK